MKPIDSPQCAKCGYDLTGLPERGGCPECGQPFNQRTGDGVKQELSPQQKSAKFMRRLRTIALALMAMGVMGCGGLLSLIAVHPRKPLVTGALLMLILLVCTVISYVTEKLED